VTSDDWYYQPRTAGHWPLLVTHHSSLGAKMIMDTRESGNASSREGLSLGEPLLLMTVCLDSESLSEVKQFVTSTPLVRLHAAVTRYMAEDEDSLQRWMHGAAPDVCLIDFDKDRKSAIHTAERIHENLHGTAIFAVSSNSQSNLIIESMRCGCSEYIVKPVNHDQLLEAIARVDGRRKEKRDLANGQVLTFLGAKGGCGATTMATHLGALLAKSYSRRTLLIELYLGLTKYRYSFYELAESKDRLDANLLHGFLLRHSSGLDVLPAPDLSEHVRHVAPDDIGQTLDYLRLRYEFVVIDCPPGLNKPNLEAIHRADQLYLVIIPEVSAIANAVRYLDYLTRAEYSQERIRVVLNRYTKRDAITEDQVEKALRRQIYWKVANDYPQVMRAIHGGDPSSQLSNSEVARTVLAWAEQIGKRSDAARETKKGARGLFNLRGRS
jgi:pilus assembly protein CpaE